MKKCDGEWGEAGEQVRRVRAVAQVVEWGGERRRLAAPSDDVYSDVQV